MADIDKIFKVVEKTLNEGDYEGSFQILSSIDLERLSISSLVKRADLFVNLKCPERADEDLTSAFLQASKDPSSKPRQLSQILSKRISIREALEKFSEALEDNNLLYDLTRDQSLLQKSQKLALMDKDSKLKNEAGEFLMILKRNLETKPGAEWHVVSISWFERWQRYVKIATFFMPEEIPFRVSSKHGQFYDHPGTIDNSDIIDEEQTSIILEEPQNAYAKICLKKGMAENFNYMLLPAPAFEYLFQIYGCRNDIKRYAIEVNDTMYQVEVVLKSISVAASIKGALETNVMNISRKDTIDSLRKRYLQLKKISLSSKVWKLNLSVISMDKLQAMIAHNDTVFLEGGKVLSEDLLIDDAEIGEQDLLLIELAKNNKFLFTDDNKQIKERCGFCQNSERLVIICQKCKNAKYCSVVCQTKHSADHKAKCRAPRRSLLRCFCRNSLNSNSDDEAAVVPVDTLTNYKSGLTGLQNLGNTCFLNAALQCLSHTNEITETFLSGKYLEFLNRNNALGTNGKLATAYAELLENLWKSSSSSFAPWKLKRIVSAYAPQFVGYQQHDSQELLGFILDRVHEDLNLVKKKPYFEDNEVVGQNDDEMARDSWRRHTLRNQSIIVDLMHGQYKSSLFCPSCKKYSYTFDPFNSITLPLPQSQEKVLNFYFIFYDGGKPPFSMACEYYQTSTLEHISEDVARILEVPKGTFVFATISNDTVKEFVPVNKIIDSMKSFTLFAYQIKPEHNSQDVIELQVAIEKGKSRSTSYSRIICIGTGANFKELHWEVFCKVKQYMQKFHSKPKIQEAYEEFMVNPAYVIYFATLKDVLCQFCREKTCRGCPIPYSNEKLKKYVAGNRVIIEISWKSNYSSLGANLQEINRCTEHPNISEITQKSRKTPVKLEECFDLFHVPEQLEKDNAWYCPTCKIHVQATKKLEIYKVPPILIIHIKRFKVNGHTKEKLYNPVDFPQTGLDIREWVIGSEIPKLYDLYAVCNHFGNLTGGHYTATCFSTLNKSWFDFKDSQVVPATGNTSASAYVLFYRART